MASMVITTMSSTRVKPWNLSLVGFFGKYMVYRVTLRYYATVDDLQVQILYYIASQFTLLETVRFLLWKIAQEIRSNSRIKIMLMAHHFIYKHPFVAISYGL
jgi:hypothetical protein